jgi:hypothetical protein
MQAPLSGKSLTLGIAIALASALTASALQALPAAAATVPVTFDSSTPTVIVSGLNKGEVVDFTAVLTSTDPDETGEGEPLNLSSTSGYSAVVTNYSVPYSGSFTAQANGETLTGWISGADGDESATVQVTLNPAPNSKANDKVKNPAANLSDTLGYAAAGLGIVTPFLVEVPPAAIVTAVAGGLFGIASIKANQIARDPIDPKYTVLARPVFYHIPAPPAGLTPWERSAYEELGKNLLTQSSLADAASTSYNRAAGAAQANRKFWAKVQYDLAVSYIHKLGWHVLAQPQLQVNLVRALKAAGVPDVSITPDQALSWETSISVNGLPSSEVHLLQSLGASADDIQMLTQLEITLDTSQIGETTLFTQLTAPATLAALKTQARALIAASYANRP